MKKSILISRLVLALAAFFVSCKKDNHSSNKTSAPLFHYDAATGKCHNAEGKEGYNTVDTNQAQTTKNCECMDLSGQELYWLLKGSNIHERFAYKILEGYNFRGAKMDSATLFFNSINHADLSGARMKNLKFGYGWINGLVDSYTELPPDACAPKDDSINCYN